MRFDVSATKENCRRMDCNGRSEQDDSNIISDKIYIKQWNIHHFFRIIDNHLDDFFEYDRCFILADNYLIAMVFTYFLRAKLAPSEYTPYNFFIALYLANIMEEDDDVTYIDLQNWAISKATDSEASDIVKNRDKLFRRMNFRCVVSLTCCEIVMHSARPEHKIWKRKRHVNHSGAISEHYRKHNFCPNCIIDYISLSSEDSEKMTDTSKAESIAEHQNKKMKFSHSNYF